MSNDTIFNDPAARRRWLLGKALESAPLKEALTLAREAERFLHGASVEPTADGSGRLPDPTAACGAADQLPPAPDEPKLEAAARAEFPVASCGDLLPTEASFPAEADQEDGITASLDGLSLVAGPDDVVRYLRQQGDVVTSAPGGTYLVNARFRDSLVELVKRANRIRAREKLPLFVLMPLASVNGYAAAEVVGLRSAD